MFSYIGIILATLEMHATSSKRLSYIANTIVHAKKTCAKYIAMVFSLVNSSATLTPSRRRCPYGHPENHFRSYSTKSLVLKLSAHMRALTASKYQYKLKSPQHVCVNLNIFVTVVPWSCMVFKNIPTRIKNSNSYILLIMPHIPAHQDAPISQGTRLTPTVPPIALVYAFRYVLSTI